MRYWDDAVEPEAYSPNQARNVPKPPQREQVYRSDQTARCSRAWLRLFIVRYTRRTEHTYLDGDDIVLFVVFTFINHVRILLSLETVQERLRMQSLLYNFFFWL